MLDQFSSQVQQQQQQQQHQQQQQQQQQQSVVPVNKVSPPIHDTRQMVVAPSYNTNMMIQGSETTFQRQQQQAHQQTQPPSYQSSVIAKNVKHANMKMQQQQSQAKMMYVKPMEGMFQSYQVPLQEMNSSVRRVEDDPLRRKWKLYACEEF